MTAECQKGLYTERYPSGLRGRFAKPLVGVSRARVRIPPAPPFYYKNKFIKRKRFPEDVVFEGTSDVAGGS